MMSHFESFAEPTLPLNFKELLLVLWIIKCIFFLGGQYAHKHKRWRSDRFQRLKPSPQQRGLLFLTKAPLHSIHVISFFTLLFVKIKLYVSFRHQPAIGHNKWVSFTCLILHFFTRHASNLRHIEPSIILFCVLHPLETILC